MGKPLKFFLAVFLLLSLLGCNAGKKIKTPVTDFEWKLSGFSLDWTTGTPRLTDSYLWINGYKGTSSDIAIPQKINIELEINLENDKKMFAIPVVGISTETFKGRGLTSVVIPKGIKYINENAFAGNNLVSVNLPDTLTSIEEGAFRGNKLESIIIPDSVTKIGSGAFAHNKLSSVQLPNTLKRIEYSVFENNNLQEITLPDRLTHIDGNAFKDNKLSSITIPKYAVELGKNIFENNPLKEIVIKQEKLRLLAQNVFNPPLFGILPQGTYILGDDANWLFQDSDGTLLSLQSYYEKLIQNDSGILADFVYLAVNHADIEMLKDCISSGADVKGRMLNGLDNTPLAEIIRGTWRRWDSSRMYYTNRTEYYKRYIDMITILLEAGAVPQYWMLRSGSYTPAVIKMLLEHGALTNPESDEYGDPPKNQKRSGSLLWDYCSYLEERWGDNGESGRNPHITESAALLLKYGEDPNYRDPDTGQTPLSLALKDSVYGTEMAELLLKHVSRPLSLEEYRLLIGLYREKESLLWDENEKKRDDPLGFNAVVLEDIRKGILNPESKDSNGKDIFDYATTTGTTDLMKGLLPYLRKSKHTIIAANETGLYIDALNAKNIPVATVLSTVMDHKFTAKDPKGNVYSLEYYAYDHETIHRSARRISGDSVYRSGPDGTRKLGENPGVIYYEPHKLYTTGSTEYGYDGDLSLYTIEGSTVNLSAAINEKREQYYRESGKEKPRDYSPHWGTFRIFGAILYASTYFKGEHALINISSGKASAYIIDTENLPIASGYIWDQWDFIISSGKAYLLTNTGDAVVFNVGRHSLSYDKTVSWQELRIPGWKGGEWIFVSGEILSAYNISSGTMRTLGTNAESRRYYSDYHYKGTDDRRWIVGRNGKSYPMPDEEYGYLYTFDKGYIYCDENYNNRTICFFENGVLRRKVILSGSAVTNASLKVYGNTLCMEMKHLAFTVDLNTMSISKAFSTEIEGYSYGNYINIFPFGADDVVYSRHFYESDH